MVKVEKLPHLANMKGPGSDLGPSKCGSTQKMAANVKVVVRVRPLNEREVEQNSRIVVDVVDDRMLVFDPKVESQPFFYQGVQQPNKNYLKRGNKELKFVFDHVCAQEAANKDVFEVTTKDMLTSLMEGYNCSVFVYGATGAGKTFTMIGSKENPGITYLTMEHLFYTINSFEKEREFDIGVSYLEVYNENVYDLLKPSKTPLQLREDHKYGVMVAGLTLNNIKTAKELLTMLENGNRNRTQHPTDANAESSRSHAVFQVYIKMSYKTSSQVRMVKLSMIDLAGSERASATGCVGERFKEGANINKSLLSLANCINKLADGCPYIPYRDSKLTRLLKDSLGGNCKTVMIANVSPAASTYEDTYNTLKYADRANKIQLSIKKNIMDGGMRVSQYVKVNEELKKKVKELEAKLTLSCVPKSNTEADMKLVRMNEELKKKVKELEEKDFVLSSRPVVKQENNSTIRRDIEKVSLEWRRRVISEAEIHAMLQSEVVALTSRARVLCLRHRLRTRALLHLADLAHRSSTEAVEEMCNETLPRQERAAKKYSKEALRLDAKIMAVWNKWNESKKRLEQTCRQAVATCPELQDLVDKIHVEIQLRHQQGKADLGQKLLMIENNEINAFTEYTGDMTSMIKKLYLTLKGYEKVTPTLTSEYLNIMKKAKSAEGISWSDRDCENDPEFKHIIDFDLDKPLVYENMLIKHEDVDVNGTVEFSTDSEDFTDIENKDPVRLSSKKRRGTPIKLVNNETIIIDDSLESLDVTKTMSSAKKLKRHNGFEKDFDEVIKQPLNLNSTFDMAGKIEALKKQIKIENGKNLNLPVKRELLSDRTNFITRANNFNSGSGARIVKPVVSRGAMAGVKRPVAGAAGGRPPPFGSSLARDGTPLVRGSVQDAKKSCVTQKSVGFKAMRGRERVQTHPYSRPTTYAARK